MAITYAPDVDPTKLNGFRATYEATKQAIPLAQEEAHRLAKAYNTPLVGSHNGRMIYLDANKYSVEDLRAGRWKNDPTIYDKPESLA